MMRPGLRALHTLLVVLVLAGLTSGCEGSQQTGVDPNAPATGPLMALSECEDMPEPADVADVVGAQLPEGAVVTSSVVQGPLTNVTAQVPTTPVNIRLAFEQRDDLQILVIEDEVFEAELLVSDGTHRTYLKASAICQTGSTLLAVVAPENSAGDALPVPAGAATAQPE